MYVYMYVCIYTYTYINMNVYLPQSQVRQLERGFGVPLSGQLLELSSLLFVLGWLGLHRIGVRVNAIYIVHINKYVYLYTYIYIYI